jgi:hypothetical protein
MKVFKFQKIAVCNILLLFAFLIISSCSIHTTSSGPKKIPPGQAKKINGSKSAKAYAPGQQKKQQ